VYGGVAKEFVGSTQQSRVYSSTENQTAGVTADVRAFGGCQQEAADPVSIL
jgi:hypothetical protein